MLDQLCSSFLASLQQASAQCLPHVRKRKTCVPDWNVSANKLKQSARFWYRVWLDCGCPSTCVVHQIKQRAKNRYKYEVHRLRRRQLLITRCRIGSALSDACHRGFWKEVRLLEGTPVVVIAITPPLMGFLPMMTLPVLFDLNLNKYSTAHRILPFMTGLVLSWTV